MAPHAAINTSEISEKARRDLLQLLEGVRGKKNLVLEKSLAGTINLLVKFSTLQEYGVDKAFFLENDNLDSSQRNVVFLVRGEKSRTMLAVAEQIKKLRRNSSVEHEFSVFWVPRRTLVSDQILEESGVLGEASVSEYPLYFIPLSENVLSLELDDAFSDLYLHKDPNSIFLSAKALMLLQHKHGLFPRILGKGDNAKRLADLLLRMRNEAVASEEDNASGSAVLGLTPSSQLESLIIIDREVDFPTVLLTQLTYEGLLDEVFNIDANQAEVDSSIVGTGANPSSSQGGASTAPPPGLKRKIQLDPKESLYGSLTDANFAVVGPLLNKVARRLLSTYEARPNIGTKSTAELRDFVAKLPGYQSEQASLKLHTSLAEEMIKYTQSDIFSRVLEVQQNIAAGADPSSQHDNIDELIARSVPLPTILRLLCIYSCMTGGFRPKDYENFKLSVLHAYGHQHMLTFSALEKMGLVQPRPGSTLASSTAVAAGHRHSSLFTNYNSVRKNLRLIVDEVNESEPDDIAYAYSGYAPLSVRLVQCILQKQYIASITNTGNRAAAYLPAQGTGNNLAAGGWRPFEDTLKQVKGATVDEVQPGEEKAVRARQILNGGAGHDKSEKTVVVFFLGGVCRAEIAALRFVEKSLREAGVARRILVCTTGIVRGDGVVGAAVEKGRFGPAE